jgi:hypothetical protein
VVVLPGKEVGGKSYKEVKRKKQQEHPEEFGNSFAVEVHTELSAFFGCHAKGSLV